MHLSLPYVQWMLAGSPLLFVYIIYTSIYAGVGDSTTPLIASGMTHLDWALCHASSDCGLFLAFQNWDCCRLLLRPF